MWGIASKPVPSRKRTAKLFLWLLRSKLGCLSIADTWTSWYFMCDSMAQLNFLKLQKIQEITKYIKLKTAFLVRQGLFLILCVPLTTPHNQLSSPERQASCHWYYQISSALGLETSLIPLISSESNNYWLDIINTVSSCENNAVINERCAALVDLQWTSLLNLNLCSSALRKGKVYTHLSDQLLLEDCTDVRPLPKLGLPGLRSHLNVSTVKRFSTIKRFR